MMGEKGDKDVKCEFTADSSIRIKKNIHTHTHIYTHFHYFT